MVIREASGSGIQRLRTEVWGWTGTGFGLIDFIWHQPRLRTHRLWEALDLYDLERLDDAEQLLAQLVAEQYDDPNEVPMGDGEATWYGSPDEPQRIAYFAAFRLALIGYSLDNSDMIDEWVTWLDNELSEDHPFREASQRLQSGYYSSESPESMCSSVVEILNQHENIRSFLPYEPGYGNPAFTVSDLCPHGQPIEWVAGG